MEKELKKVFHNAIYKESSAQNSILSENIWGNIVLHDKRVALFKLGAFSLTFLASLIGLISTWKLLSSDLAQSGLYEYFSLVFSSGSSIFSYWKELALSIAESLPTMSIILSLSLILVSFTSLKFMVKQIVKGQLLSINV
jgi:hypothetical protein